MLALIHMILANDLKKDTIFLLDEQPHKVLSTVHVKKARQGATVQLKLKNLISGSTISRNVSSNERFEKAEIERRELEFVYNHRGEYVFSDPQDKSQRFSLSEEQLGDTKLFLKEGLRVGAEYFNDKIINIVLPIKVDYKVIEAPPNVKGNTASGGAKTVIIESGAQIQAPLFIEEGDVIKVNTQKGEYAERAK